MALTDGEGPVTSSYIGSLCIVPSAMFDCAKAAIILDLLLLEIIANTVMETTTQIIRAVARNPIDIMYAVAVSELYMLRFSVVCLLSVGPVSSTALKIILTGSLALPVIFPQTTFCTASAHTLPSVGTSVQVIFVMLVVVGQLPQFDARML